MKKIKTKFELEKELELEVREREEEANRYIRQELALKELPTNHDTLCAADVGMSIMFNLACLLECKSKSKNNIEIMNKMEKLEYDVQGMWLKLERGY